MKRPLFLLTILSSIACCTSFSHCSSSYSCGSFLLMSPFLQKTIGLMKNEFWGGRGMYFRTLSMRASRSSSDSGDGSNKNKKQKSLAPKYLPKTANQKIYCNCLSDVNASIVLGVGPAGTGKTLFACTSAIQMLQRGDIHKIVLTRPVVAVEEELGFLPGNMVMKMDPWTRPIFDIFLEFYAQKDIDAMVQAGTIEISPLAYMRGRTFKRAFIIADEMQNSSPNQMLMLITRIGDGSKMVITGDLKQSDRMTENGLQDLIRKIYCRSHLSVNSSLDKAGGAVSLGGIRAVKFISDDIERSPIVKQVLALYEPSQLSVVVDAGLASMSSSNTNVSNSTIAVSTNTTCDFEFVSSDDAALIPKQLISKHFLGENYGQYSSGKWTGW